MTLDNNVCCATEQLPGAQEPRARSNNGTVRAIHHCMAKAREPMAISYNRIGLRRLVRNSRLSVPTVRNGKRVISQSYQLKDTVGGQNCSQINPKRRWQNETRHCLDGGLGTSNQCEVRFLLNNKSRPLERNPIRCNKCQRGFDEKANLWRGNCLDGPSNANELVKNFSITCGFRTNALILDQYFPGQKRSKLKHCQTKLGLLRDCVNKDIKPNGSTQTATGQTSLPSHYPVRRTRSSHSLSSTVRSHPKGQPNSDTQLKVVYR